MTAQNFARSLALVLKHEGAFTSNPKDPGNWTGGKIGVGDLGGTNRGVTLATFRSHFGKDKTVADLKAITTAQLAQVYRHGYWSVVGGDRLADGVDYATFDAAVNSGPGRALKWLRQAVGSNDHAVTVKKLCAVRLGFVRGLGTWSVFGKGWARRIAEVEAIGVAWANAAANQSVPVEAKKDAKKADTAAKGNATAAAGTATGAGGAATQLDPATFDWTAWLFVGGIALVAVGLVVFFIHRWRVNRIRSEAYAAVVAGEIG